MERIPGIRYANMKGSPVPKSATYSLNMCEGRVERAEEEEDSCKLWDWFPDVKADLTFNEDVIGLGRYGKTLTIIWREEIPEEITQEEPEFDPEYFTPDGKRYRW